MTINVNGFFPEARIPDYICKSGVCTVEEMWGDGQPYDIRVWFSMSQEDWKIVEKSNQFQALADYLKYDTAYRHLERKYEKYYWVHEFTEGECFHSVSVGFSLAYHDWLKLSWSDCLRNLIEYLQAVEMPNTHRENHKRLN